MRRYRVVNKNRFERFVNMVKLVALIGLVALFVMFMNKHNGIGTKIMEHHTYEIVYETSEENSRLKVPVAREVVYKTIYR